MTDTAVQRYFAERYPARDDRFARWFRAGERERRAAIAPWLADIRGSLLDVGAGDGRFLASVLGRERIDRLTLVDLSARALAGAAAALADRAHEIETHAGDVHALHLLPADVVLALGVTDYAGDWPALLRRLRSLARVEVIVDFPRVGRLRSILRRAWLRLHGIALHTGSRNAVCDALDRSTIREMTGTRLHWIARISGGAR